MVILTVLILPIHVHYTYFHFSVLFLISFITVFQFSFTSLSTFMPRLFFCMSIHVTMPLTSLPDSLLLVYRNTLELPWRQLAETFNDWTFKNNFSQLNCCFPGEKVCQVLSKSPPNHWFIFYFDPPHFYDLTSEPILKISSRYIYFMKKMGIHTEETRCERDTCTPMFITALFIIARTWKQPRCPSVDEWIRKLWYIYTMEYYSAIKKNSSESVLIR